MSTVNSNAVAGEAAQDVDVEFVYNKINNAMSHFDRIFGNVVTISRDAHDQRNQSTVLVDASLFDVNQNEAIIQLSGYLTSIFGHIQTVRLKAVHNRCSMKDVNVAFETPADQEEATAKLRKRISLLQDMLVQEINKSEELETSLRKSEADLLSATDAKNDLQRKLERLQKRERIMGVSGVSTSESLVSSVSFEAQPQLPTAESTLVGNPSDLLGRYVRKQFDKRKYFGVITSFEAPFFMVIYEDGDREEIDSKELKDILWEGTVPTGNKSLLARHEKLYIESQAKEETTSSVSSTSHKSNRKSKSTTSSGSKSSANSSLPPDDIISPPMDLGTVATRVEEGHTSSTAETTRSPNSSSSSDQSEENFQVHRGNHALASFTLTHPMQLSQGTRLKRLRDIDDYNEEEDEGVKRSKILIDLSSDD